MLRMQMRFGVKNKGCLSLFVCGSAGGWWWWLVVGGWWLVVGGWWLVPVLSA